MAKLKEFNGEDDWEQYCERLEFHFEAHEITNGGKKKATLLSVCGAQTYKLMCDLVAPLKPKDKTFDELKDVVQKHLKPITYVKLSSNTSFCHFNLKNKIKIESRGHP